MWRHWFLQEYQLSELGYTMILIGWRRFKFRVNSSIPQINPTHICHMGGRLFVTFLDFYQLGFSTGLIIYLYSKHILVTHGGSSTWGKTRLSLLAPGIRRQLAVGLLLKAGWNLVLRFRYYTALLSTKEFCAMFVQLHHLHVEQIVRGSKVVCFFVYEEY